MSISGEDAVKSPSENTATAGGESFLIVVVALGANLLIAVAKTSMSRVAWILGDDPR